MTGYCTVVGSANAAPSSAAVFGWRLWYTVSSHSEKSLAVYGLSSGSTTSSNKDALCNLLTKVSYNPSSDVLFFAGDLLAKSSHATSLNVMDFLTKHHNVNGTERIFPVRGNHDHLVIQWRAWREWFEELTVPVPSASSHAPFFLRIPMALTTHLSVVIRSMLGADQEYSVNQQRSPVSTGREFLQLIEAEWALEKMENEPDPEEYAEVARKRAKGTWREAWWLRIPPPGKGKTSQSWNLFTDHYWLARDLTVEQANYLTSLPLVQHIPHLHMFIAHAGLLPSDPRLSPTDPRQPLTHMPHMKPRERPIGYDPDTDVDGAEDPEDRFTSSSRQRHAPTIHEQAPAQAQTLSMRPKSNWTSDDLRRMQETALLEEIPQNRDPWVVLNMRGIKKKGKITRDGDEGTPWSETWNDHMGWCDGFEDELAPGTLVENTVRDEREDIAQDEAGAVEPLKKKPKYSLTCQPASVVYGHAASRGLDVKRWSVGLDTGCLYGRRLTALVLSGSGGDEHGDEDDEDEDDEEDDHEHDDEDEEDDIHFLKSKHIRFGDRTANIKARLYHVDCPNLDLSSSS
ncbi:hypothetical protein EIP86_004650 [Pleurotus ostreatoroseus]|nr:hypothetical protein EIP86_004650 [Pleurotus ostreatoroseus]